MFVDVLVSCGSDRMAELLAQGEPILSPIWTRGMIDTGTNVSAVSLAIIHQLEIPPGKAARSEGIGGEYASHYYDVSFTIADKPAKSGPTYSPPDVSVIHMEAVGVDVLIGLDLLVACRLVVDGPARLFTLEF